MDKATLLPAKSLALLLSKRQFCDENADLDYGNARAIRYNDDNTARIAYRLRHL
jgi:hypothetical protein